VGVEEQYLLIRSGIEIEAYRDVAIGRDQARDRLDLPRDAFVVVCVGRLSHVKAPLDMVSAFDRLARRHAHAHLVMVGDGPMRSDVEAAVERLGLTGRVHLLGLRRDVPEILRASDVLALASLGEGLPRVFPQAMAAGLPIVATDVDGAPEVITDGENGWRVRVGAPDELGARLIELADDPARAKRMGERGRERVEEFSARGMVRRLEELYTRLAIRKGVLREPSRAQDPRREMKPGGIAAGSAGTSPPR
jgi:glycosyltransferase involved in cell wall biosynthesis